MTRRRRTPPVMCGRKRRHPTELDAIGSAIRCSARRGIALRVYACPACGGWRLTKWTSPAPGSGTSSTPTSTTVPTEENR